MERPLLQFVAAVKKCELDHESDPDDFSSELPDQPQGGPHRTTRGEQVVDGEHALPGLDRVFVNGQRITAVLELVLDLDGLARKLAGLAHRNEASPELVRDRAAHDEAARFDPDHDVDSLRAIPLDERVDHVAKSLTVFEERRDVLEEDAVGREVLDVTDLPLELGDVHRRLYYRDCRGALDANVSGPWQRDTLCRPNVSLVTSAPQPAESLKSSDFQPRPVMPPRVAPSLLPLGASIGGGGRGMLLPEQVQRLVELALAEFAPEWQVTGLCSELSLHNPDHWVSGLGTFGLILRNRNSRSAKVL